MSSRLSHTSGLSKIVIIIEFLLVSYLLYSLTKNIYDSYQVDVYIKAFEHENYLIAEENKQKTEDYLYFTSSEYIDKIAKQNLSLVNSGEEVIILSSDILSADDVSDGSGLGGFAVNGEMSNARQWWRFFFGD